MKLIITLKESDIKKIKHNSMIKHHKEMISSSCTKHTVIRNKKKYNRKNKHKSSLSIG